MADFDANDDNDPRVKRFDYHERMSKQHKEAAAKNKQSALKNNSRHDAHIDAMDDHEMASLAHEMAGDEHYYRGEEQDNKGDDLSRLADHLSHKLGVKTEDPLMAKKESKSVRDEIKSAVETPGTQHAYGRLLGGKKDDESQKKQDNRPGNIRARQRKDTSI